MKNILITGANGYIGSHVANQLNKDNNIKLTAVDFNNSRLDSTVNFINKNILQDCKDPNLYATLGEPDICIHLAWQDGFTHNAESHIDNLPYHFHFLQNMIEHGCSHIIVAGSMREYGKVSGKVSEDSITNKADNYYTCAKLTLKNLLDIYLKNKNVCFQWLRFFTPYGHDELSNSIFGKIIMWEKEGKTTFPFTDGKEQYDYIHIDDLTKQIIAVAMQTKVQGIINCCSGKPSSLKDRVEELINNNHYKIRPLYGTYPSRSYDSDVIYGDNTKITTIVQEFEKNKCQ